MARRRKNENLAEILIELPWWVAACCGIAAYVGLRWIIPAMLPPLLKGMGTGLEAIAWFAPAIFGFISVLSLARSKVKPQLRTASRSSAGGERVDRRKFEPAVIKPANKLSHEWGHDHSNPPAMVSGTEVPREWTLDGLRELEWKRFELLCAKYYEMTGFRSETIRCGADGGVDVKLYRIDPHKPLAIVQCKAWNSSQVGVAPVRELLGVMTSEKVGRGIFLTTSTFTKDAIAFAEVNPIQLLDGPGFLSRIQNLPDPARMALMKFAFEGDYSTPTCASCGVKMIKRESKRGTFWGCVNYPRCKSNFPIKSRAKL